MAKKKTRNSMPVDKRMAAKDMALMNVCQLLSPDIFNTNLTEEVLESKERCEKNLYTFVKEAWPICNPNEPFIDGWVLGCIAEHLQACAERQIMKLLINLPRRHGKSWISSVLLFCWVWARKPHEKFIVGSYSERFAYRDSLRAAALIETQWYQDRWGSRYRMIEQQRSQITNNQGGHRIACSPQGRGVGEGGRFLVGDDLDKPEDVHTQAGQEVARRFWSETMAGCADDPLDTVRLLIQQRLGNDLSAWIIARDIGYETLIFPAHYNPKRIFLNYQMGKEANCKNPIVPTTLQRRRPELMDYRTEPGQILFPERFNEQALEELAREYIGVAKDAQLEQDPNAEGGELIKSEWFRYFHTRTIPTQTDHGVEYKDYVILETKQVLNEDGTVSAGIQIPIEDVHLFQIIDTALVDNDRAAYTAIATLAIAVKKGQRGSNGVSTPDRRFLLVWHMVRERLLVNEQEMAIEELKEGEAQWDPETREFIIRACDRPWIKPLLFQAVEKKASGYGLLQSALAKGRPLRAIEGKEYSGGKVQRAVPLVDLYKNNLVFHKRGERWLPIYEDEAMTFPSAAKDQIDCAAYGAIMFIRDSILLRLTTSDCSMSIAAEQERNNQDGSLKKMQVGVHTIQLPNDDFFND